MTICPTGTKKPDVQFISPKFHDTRRRNSCVMFIDYVGVRVITLAARQIRDPNQYIH
jgi:hypothetical protein